MRTSETDTGLVPTWHRKTSKKPEISTLFEVRCNNFVVLFDLFLGKCG